LFIQSFSTLYISLFSYKTGSWSSSGSEWCNIWDICWSKYKRSFALCRSFSWNEFSSSDGTKSWSITRLSSFEFSKRWCSNKKIFDCLLVLQNTRFHTYHLPENNIYRKFDDLQEKNTDIADDPHLLFKNRFDEYYVMDQDDENLFF